MKRTRVYYPPSKHGPLLTPAGTKPPARCPRCGATKPCDRHGRKGHALMLNQVPTAADCGESGPGAGECCPPCCPARVEMVLFGQPVKVSADGPGRDA